MEKQRRCIMPKFKATFEKIANNEIIVDADNDVQAHVRAKALRVEQITPRKVTIEEIIEEKK
jgi:hypothetical protein